MGFIANTANTVYGDYNTPGVPSSGAKQPSKAAIRSLFANIDQALISTPQWHNAVGDGVTDDTAAFAATIADGKNINLAGRTFRITSRLNFSTANQQIIGPGTLLFDGPSTDRLADVSANGVTFNGVEFDGNGKQVFFGLVGVRSGVKRATFFKSHFHDVAGTHAGGTATVKECNQYGVVIDPNGTDFCFLDSTFENITNDNTNAGVPGGVATAGFGFCGGILTYPADGSVPGAVQIAAVTGEIIGCRFLNINTVLDNGLTAPQVGNLNDADAIRFYAPNYSYDYFINTDDCYFYKIGKRAVKGGGSRWSFSNSAIFAPSSMQYQMVTALKPDGDNVTVHHIKCYASTTKPFNCGIQTHDGIGLTIEDFSINYCDYVWQIAPTNPGAILSDYRIRSLRTAANAQGLDGYTTSGGIVQLTAFTATRGWRVDDIDFVAGPNAHGIKGLGIVPSSGELWSCWDRVRLAGMEVKLGEQGIEGGVLDMTVKDSAWVGSASDRMVCELSNVLTGTPLRGSYFDTVILRIEQLQNSYYSATRPAIAAFAGKWKIDKLVIDLPTGITMSFFPIVMYGSDLVIDDVHYYSDREISFMEFAKASYGPYRNSRINRAVRQTKGEAVNAYFLYLGNGQNCEIGAVTDTSVTTAPCVYVFDGTPAAGAAKAWMLGPISHRSSHSFPLYDPGAKASSIAGTVRIW